MKDNDDDEEGHATAEGIMQGREPKTRLGDTPASFNSSSALMLTIHVLIPSPF